MHFHIIFKEPTNRKFIAPYINAAVAPAPILSLVYIIMSIIQYIHIFIFTFI